MDNLTPTTLWAIFGLILIILEVLTTSFFLLFFGVSALLVAGFKLIGLNHMNTEILIFALGGVAGILVFRKKLLTSFTSPTTEASVDNNKEITLSHAIAKGTEGKIEYQGTTWTALNPTNTDMPKGSKVLIEKTESTKLILKHKSL